MNDIECTKENCSVLIKKLLGTDEEFEIKKSRKIIELNQNNKINISMSLPLKSNFIRTVIASGQQNFQKLIDLALNATDSGLSAEQDFGLHFQQCESDFKNLYEFISSYSVEKNTLLSGEIQNMFTEVSVLILMNLVFAISRACSKEGEQYMKRYGSDCLAQIALFSTSLEMNKTYDVQEANTYIKDVLNNISSIEEKLKKNSRYIPASKSYALNTLKQIEEMAHKYSKIFEEHLAMAAGPQNEKTKATSSHMNSILSIFNKKQDREPSPERSRSTLSLNPN